VVEDLRWVPFHWRRGLPGSKLDSLVAPKIRTCLRRSEALERSVPIVLARHVVAQKASADKRLCSPSPSANPFGKLRARSTPSRSRRRVLRAGSTPSRSRRRVLRAGSFGRLRSGYAREEDVGVSELADARLIARAGGGTIRR